MAKLTVSINKTNTDAAEETLRDFARGVLAGTIVESSYTGILATILYHNLDAEAVLELDGHLA